ASRRSLRLVLPGSRGPADRLLARSAAVSAPAASAPAKGEGTYNVVVIGAGTGGLVAAAGTAALGGRVALIERHRMGGDCLNSGCVPSKALISSARLLHAMRDRAHGGMRP